MEIQNGRAEQPARLGWREAVMGLVLVITALCLFGPVLDNGFISFDDPLYVSGNPHINGFTGENIAFAFGRFQAGYWIPVTWLSYMADFALWGEGPRGFHFTNILLHAINSLLLFLVFFRLTKSSWRSFLVAALFAVHPLNVESVAWISERKGLLAAFFSFASLLAYEAYYRKPDVLRYLAVFLTAALAMMAKPVAVMLPVLFLILDYWPLGRFSGPDFRASVGRLALEKTPVFALSLIFGIITVLAHRAFGALQSDLSFSIRVQNAVISYALYLKKMVWPFDLAVFYPHPAGGISMITAASCALLLVAATLFFLQLSARRPQVFAGWLWYLLAIFPAIGLAQAGGQAMADRFAYAPLIGIFFAISFSLPGASTGLKRLIVVACAGVVIFFAAAAVRQAGYWENPESLFGHAVAVTKDNYYAENRLGLALADKGEAHEATAHFEKAAALKPGYAAARNNLAGAYMANGEFDRAADELKALLKLNPKGATPEIYNNLGAATASNGDFSEAAGWFAKAAKLSPRDVRIRYNLANSLFLASRIPEAERELKAVLALDPTNEKARQRLQQIIDGTQRK